MTVGDQNVARGVVVYEDRIPVVYYYLTGTVRVPDVANGDVAVRYSHYRFVTLVYVHEGCHIVLGTEGEEGAIEIVYHRDDGIEGQTVRARNVQGSVWMGYG